MRGLRDGDGAGQAANLLGALSLAIADRMEGAVTGPGLSMSDAAALSALRQFLVAPTVDLLAKVLGLTSSGTVRLVDRLEAAGLVRRATDGDGDGRATVIALTAGGRRRADAVTRARNDILAGALDVLSDAERRRFAALAGRVLAGMVRPPGATKWTCRLCDTVACGRPDDRCPVFEEAKRRYAGGPM